MTSILDDTDHALTKAAECELEMLTLLPGDAREKVKRKANLYFKKAMKNDGNTHFTGLVI